MALSIFAPVAASMLALAAPPANPVTDLTLALDHGSGQTVSVDLRCQPADGNHPDPARACSVLSGVDGDFDRLPHDSSICPDLWTPVSATANGQWRGRPVRFTHTYSNPCLAGAESSGIFAF
jgi:subtilisin inhibitor-like